MHGITNTKVCLAKHYLCMEITTFWPNSSLWISFEGLNQKADFHETVYLRCDSGGHYRDERVNFLQ